MNANLKVSVAHLIAIVAPATVKVDTALKMAESISVYQLDALAQRIRIAAQTTVLSAVKLAAVISLSLV